MDIYFFLSCQYNIILKQSVAFGEMLTVSSHLNEKYFLSSHYTHYNRKIWYLGLKNNF